jgi:hypothetical protein
MISSQNTPPQPQHSTSTASNDTPKNQKVVCVCVCASGCWLLCAVLGEGGGVMHVCMLHVLVCVSARAVSLLTVRAIVRSRAIFVFFVL